MKIEPHIMTVLEAAAVNENALTLTGKLDRKTYEQANKVLTAIGGTWNRKAKAHLFDGPVEEVLEPILLTGEYSRTKQDFGQFDTPPELAADVIRRAGISTADRVLEPSAGLGNIACAARAAGGDVHCIEIDQKRVEALRNDGFTALHQDFLTVDPSEDYDCVVMNPPFARQADIDHVVHATKFLRPGGRLVAIMSASVGFRTNAKTVDFRALADLIDPLPEGSFSGSGTNVNTVIVEITAKS